VLLVFYKNTFTKQNAEMTWNLLCLSS